MSFIIFSLCYQHVAKFLFVKKMSSVTNLSGANLTRTSVLQKHFAFLVRCVSQVYVKIKHVCSCVSYLSMAWCREKEMMSIKNTFITCLVARDNMVCLSKVLIGLIASTEQNMTRDSKIIVKFFKSYLNVEKAIVGKGIFIFNFLCLLSLW